ncbi:MAG: chemotaxis protein CheX [Pseudomonadales bacterium]|nr:chemotaxis protein CheX [Pseudomonadales bacterium]
MSTLNIELHKMLESAGNRTDMYLVTETQIQTDKITYQFKNVNQIELYELTSIIAVGGNFSVLFAFSFERSVAEQIMLDFTADFPIGDMDKEDCIKETVAELINIVLGNVLTDFSDQKEIISLTPPIVISDAKNIYRDKSAVFLSAYLHSNFGSMQIHCIAPEEMFDQQLNYKNTNAK